MSISVQQAAEIMGKNFVGIEEGERHFGPIVYTQNRTRVARARFDEETLKRRATSHALVLDSGVSILTMHKTEHFHFTDPFNQGPWYEQMEPGRRIEAPQWRLIPLVPLPFSCEKTKKEQEEFVELWMQQHPRRIVTIPAARHVVFATMLLWKIHGINILNDGEEIRTKDATKQDRTMVVGPFVDGVLTVGTANHQEASRTLGTMVLPNHRWYTMPE